MTDGDCSVLLEQEQRHGFADDIAASHDYGVFPRDGNFVALEQLDDACGRTGLQAVPAGCQQADVIRMESIDVFLGRHGQQNAAGIDLGGERKLHQNTVDLRTPVQLGHNSEKIFSRTRHGRGDGFVVNAELAGCLGLVADVDFGARIVANAHGMREKLRDARTAFVFNLIADAIPVENQGHPTNLSDAVL